MSISNHCWGCTTQSCLIRAGVPGTASSLLQQRLQVSTARPATKDARTTHIRGLSAISLGLQSRSFPLVHLNTGLEWCNPPPSATRHFSPSHTLFSPFTCNTCNDLFLEFNACQRKSDYQGLTCPDSPTFPLVMYRSILSSDAVLP